MTTLHRPETTPAVRDPEGEELDHLCCCSWDVAICGLDVSDNNVYEARGVVIDADTCLACVYNASDDDWHCPLCGCAWYQHCDRDIR
jgi:hypothetical protein